MDKCNAVMPFGDDHGDNTCSFRCMLEKGHEGKHKEWANLYNKYPYTLEWEGDYRDEEDFVWCWIGDEAGRTEVAEAWLEEFEEIAKKHNLVYKVERNETSIDVMLDGHAKEIYEDELCSEREKNGEGEEW